MHKDIMSLLNRLGLKNNESKLYLACLRNRDGLFLYELVKETRIVRSTADLIVKRLVQRGFLNQVKVGRRLRYFAQPPESMLFRQKQIVEELEQAVPFLSGIGGEKKDMEILYFEGAEGFRQVQNDILLHLQFATGDKRSLLGFYSSLDYLKIFPNAQKAFIQKRIKMGIWGKGIATDEAAARAEWTNDPKRLRAFKFIEKERFPFRMIIEIYADNVMLYSPVKPIGGVIIRNEQIAASMRVLFSLLWELLPES